MQAAPSLSAPRSSPAPANLPHRVGAAGCGLGGGIPLHLGPRSVMLSRLLARQRARLPAVWCRAASISAARPPAKVGDTLAEVDTPALILELDVFTGNCAQLRRTMRQQFPGVVVRPHCKAHKTAAIALLQLQMLGDVARGVCVQKVCEAEAMFEGGLRDILVSNQIVAPAKIRRLAAMAAQGATISVCVDNPGNLCDLSAEARAAGCTLGVVVEVDAGQGRCGVDDPQQAVELARQAAELPGLRFLGVQAYHGGLQHTRDPADRSAAVGRVVDIAQATVEALRAAGLACQVVTGGGTGSYRIEAGSGVYTEVQPGSFAFGDADYARNVQEDGQVGEWGQSLWVLTEVMSVSARRHMAVVDAGLKAISMDSGPPRLPAEQTDGVQVEYESGGDEHGKLLFPGVWQAADGQLPGIGTRYLLQPGHCDPTFNMYDWLVACREGRVEHVWPIRGRGPGN